MNNIQLTLADKVARIVIEGVISDWTENSASEFRVKFNELTATATSVEVYLNTPGGSVWDAMEIGNILSEYKNLKVAVLGALCASAGTVIATHCDKIIASSNTHYMIHNPRMVVVCDKESDFESNKNLWVGTKENLIDLYEKKTKINRSALSNLLNATTWMTAKQAKDKGFIDEIKNEVAKVSNEFVLSVTNELRGQRVSIPQLIIENNLNHKNNDMKEVNKMLGLLDNASEGDLVNAINALKAEKEKLQHSAKKIAQALALANGVEEKNVESVGKLILDNYEGAMSLLTCQSRQADNVEASKVNVLNIADHTKRDDKNPLSKFENKKWEELTTAERQELYLTDKIAYDKLVFGNN